MPKKKIRGWRTRPRQATVLFAKIYDPDNRQGNVRLIIEGPFPDNASAVAALRMLVEDGSYSVSDTHYFTVSSAKAYHDSINKVRAILKR